jgi:hypothetical protein
LRHYLTNTASDIKGTRAGLVRQKRIRILGVERRIPTGQVFGISRVLAIIGIVVGHLIQICWELQRSG